MAFSQDLLNRLTIALAEPAAAVELDAAVSAATGEISDVAYNATTWDGVTAVGASKNALRDKIVAMDAATVAVVAQTITNGVTSSCPSQDAVFDALALKQDVSSLAADAQAACISQVITNGVTDKSPSEDAVFDALALKLTATQAANVAALAGTLTGSVTGTMADVAASACGGGGTPANTDVDTCVASLALAVNLQLKELQTKVNAEIAALKLTNIQASV